MARNNNPFMNLEEYEKLIGNPRAFIENFCYITTKEGKFELLKLNYAQDRLMKIVEDCLAKHKPIRVRILKARQMGMSTLISALGFWWAAMNENSSYAVVAHKDSSASSIFEKNKIFYDNLPSTLKPKTDKFNSEHISFNDKTQGDFDIVSGLRSKIFFGTAGGGELFRGQTVLFLHKSEIAFWFDPTGILKKSLNAAVPLTPFSAIIEETTANGYNEFKDYWDRSVRGKDNYTPLFIGWNEMKEYRMTPPSDFVPTQEELELQMQFDLDDAQLCWRRYKIENDFDGNVRWFQQEYPLTPEEAFIASGLGVFDSELLDKGYKGSANPIREMAMTSYAIRQKLKIWEEPESKEIVEYEQLSRWSDEKQKYEYVNGDIEVARKTVYANYTIGIDTAGMGADFIEFCVWHNIKKICVARLEAHGIPEEMIAKLAVEIAKMYNNAMIAPETNYSHAVVDYIVALGYTNIYLTENVKRIDKKSESLTYGWVTTTITKPQMISALRMLLRENPSAIQDKEFWYQAEYFVLENVQKNIMNAVSGHHDDIIIADAIAYYVSCSMQSKQVYSTRTKKIDSNSTRNGIIGVERLSKPKKGILLKKGVYNNHA